MTTGLIVPAAGRGERLGTGRPKALHLLAGEPLLVHAVRAALASGVIDVVVVAAPADAQDNVRALLVSHVSRLQVVAGGIDRRDSVASALHRMPADVDTVLVHDAARCLAPPAMFARVAKEVAAGYPAVVPVMPLADTVKRVDGDLVIETPDRSTLRAVQTPQGFRRDVLEHAHATVTGAVTDDASLVERVGVAVRVVQGHDEAFKITNPIDLSLAEAVLRRRMGDT